MDDRLTDNLRRIETPEGAHVLAFDCPCGEEPEGNMAVVKWDEPVAGIEHSFCHVKCLQKRSHNE